MRSLLAALLCLLALLAPAAGVWAQGPDASACADGCCDETDCGGETDDGCPQGCPDCACSAAARVAVPCPEAAPPPPAETLVAESAEVALRLPDGDPREILHVPRA